MQTIQNLSHQSLPRFSSAHTAFDATSGRVLVVIDSAIDDHDSLRQGVIPGVETILLDPALDGIEQLTAALANYRNLARLHLVAHGKAGQIHLGSTVLSSANLITYAGALQQWRQSFSSDAALLLYSCDLAAGDAGKAFVNQMSQLLEVGVAAADRPLGNAPLGGGWELAVKTATFEVKPAFQPQVLQTYAHWLGVSINDVSITEGNSGTKSLKFTVSLDAAPTEDVTVDYTTAEDSATAESDFTAVSGTLTFTPTVTSQTITVPILGDIANEASELFFVNLSNPSANISITDDQGVGIILNDDPLPNLSIDDVNLDEGDSGTTQAEFTVTLSGTSDQFVTVNFKTGNGTATLLNNDYTETSGKLIFSPGETTKTITVPVIGNTANEADETFQVNLSGAKNASIADGQGIGTISNDDPLPSLSVGNISVNEGGNATFTVSLSAASGQPVTVKYATLDGTATTANQDYTAATDTLTFASGETSKSVVIATTNDTRYELDETFSIQLSDAANATIGTAQGTATITNDDPLPSLTIANETVTETDSGSQILTFTVTLSNASSQPVEVNYAAVDGTATDGDGDYRLAAGKLTFASGETSQTISVAVNGDEKYELNETFEIKLSNPVGATIQKGEATGTITNNDPLPTVSITEGSATEGNSGKTPASFTVSLSNPSYQTITVAYATADETANSSDYGGVSGGVISFAPGETSQTIEVQVNGDTVDESNETFLVNLSNPTQATLGTSQATGTIIDDDGIPTLSIAEVSVSEGDSGITEAIFTVSLSNPTNQTVTVNYATEDGTAKTSDSDYTQTSGTLTFTAGETTQTITVPVSGDLQDELDEDFLLKLSGATNATIATGQATGSITDDDAAPAVSIDDIEVLEGNSGTVNAVFTVSLSSPSSQPITVNYATADDTAKSSDNDYIAMIGGSLTFTPGQTSQKIMIAVKGDTQKEPDETFLVNLTSNDVTIADAQGLGIIRTDEAVPGLSIGDVSITEGDDGTTQAVFTVSLSETFSEPVTVEYQTGDATATVANQDYDTAVGTLTFTPGNTSQTIAVAINSDQIRESNETFLVTLANPTNATLIDAEATGTITNDDPLPSLSIGNVSLNEGTGSPSTATFTINLNSASGETIQVDYETVDGTAIASDGDYRSVSRTPLIFNPGETNKTVTVTVEGDTKVEPDETFQVRLLNPTNAVLAQATGVATLTNDDASTTPVPDPNDPDNADPDEADNGSNPSGGNQSSGSIGTAQNDTLQGTDGDDLLQGGAGNDILFGGEGQDQLFGEQDNDLLYGGKGDDLLSGGQGKDQLFGRRGRDILTGDRGIDKLYGRRGKDDLWGRAGDDWLSGGFGDDLLIGGMGSDRLRGCQGKDRFMFETSQQGGDTILDFALRQDVIVVSAKGFKSGLKKGLLRRAQFQQADSAADATDRFIYHSETGALYFDADGTGAASKILLAQLHSGLNLTHRAIVVSA